MFEEVIKKGRVKIEGKKRRILAHRENGKVELYNEHIHKTRISLEKQLRLDRFVLQSLASNLIEKYQLALDTDSFLSILTESLSYHDLGKCSPYFQKQKMDNEDFKGWEFPESFEPTSNHSYLGAIFFSLHLLRNYDLDSNLVLLTLPYVIEGHHTRLRNVTSEKYGLASLAEDEKYHKYEGDLVYLSRIYGGVNYEVKKLKGEIEKLRELFQLYIDGLKEDSHLLSTFYNYVYSLLIRSDFLAAANAFLSENAFKEELSEFFNRIEEPTIYKMRRGFEKKQEEYDKSVEDNELNPLRQKMGREALGNLKEGINSGDRVFFLKMPTGGGKTHTSLSLSLELLEGTDINRIIYALPYTSLLEQNYDYIRSVLKLETADEVRGIYSYSDLSHQSEKAETVMNRDDFFEYPFICTTNVSLMNSVLKFDKSNSYRFSALANSVMVLDEIQSLPRKYWPEFNYLLNTLSLELNIYVVLMSATVPSLEKLKHSRKQEEKFAKDVNYLIDQPHQYFQEFKRNCLVEPNFDRVKIAEDDISNLTDYVLKKAKVNFEHGRNHGLVVVNTVDLSRKLYRNLTRKLYGKTEVLLLNSTLLSGRKRQIINRINDLDTEQKTILISTQSIEAGMDVSFHFVIRDIAPLESIEQVRGRCNREKELQKGLVYLIQIEGKEGNLEANKIYQQWIIDETKEAIECDGSDYDSNDIDLYFDSCIEKINETTEKKHELTSADNIACWNKLKYEETNKQANKNRNVFHVDVIEEEYNSYSFFVPTKLNSELFSTEDLAFLKQRVEKQEVSSLIKGGKVKGSVVLELYQKELSEKDRSYRRSKILKQKFSSLISKFTFSSALTLTEKKLEDKFEKIGPYFVIPKNMIGESDGLYSVTKGFNRSYFK